MRFPPPIRYYAPLLVLVFGLVAIWLDYELNLENDLTRNFNDVSDQAEITGKRLAAIATAHLRNGRPEEVQEVLTAWQDEPWLLLAALVNDSGVMLADSDAKWKNQLLSTSPLAPAEPLTHLPQPQGRLLEIRTLTDARVYAANPVILGNNRTGWLLLAFDRKDIMALARADARHQLIWVASAMTFLCFCLWAALHYGLTSRLNKLTRAVREYGEGGRVMPPPLPGADEVSELSQTFTIMAENLARRARERKNLEKEILETSERERRRIGNDLHDDIGQRLTAASLSTNGLSASLAHASSSLTMQADALGVQLRETIAAVRALSHGLSPMGLAEDGLTAALQELAHATTLAAGIRCLVECPEPVRIHDEEIAGHLYRIAQEATNNALKHAAPAEIRISLRQRGEQVEMEIEDDGDGPPDTPSLARGIGLQLMRYRAEISGGTLEMTAAPAGGTLIRVILPFHH